MVAGLKEEVGQLSEAKENLTEEVQRGKEANEKKLSEIEEVSNRFFLRVICSHC